MQLKTILFDTGKSSGFADLGLLALRIGSGLGIAVNHGWPKLANFGDRAAKFSDPLGIGSELSMSLAVFGELFCGGLLVVGLLTRLATVPLVATMAVAFFIHHRDDPFKVKELAFVYLVAFVALFFTGPGRISVDGLVRKR